MEFAACQITIHSLHCIISFQHSLCHQSQPTSAHLSPAQSSSVQSSSAKVSTQTAHIENEAGFLFPGSLQRIAGVCLGSPHRHDRSARTDPFSYDTPHIILSSRNTYFIWQLSNPQLFLSNLGLIAGKNGPCTFCTIQFRHFGSHLASPHFPSWNLTQRLRSAYGGSTSRLLRMQLRSCVTGISNMHARYTGKSESESYLSQVTFISPAAEFSVCRVSCMQMPYVALRRFISGTQRTLCCDACFSTAST